MSPQQSEHQASQPVRVDCMTCEYRVPSRYNRNPMEFDKCAKWYQLHGEHHYCLILNRKRNCDLYTLALPKPTLMQRLWRWICPK